MNGHPRCGWVVAGCGWALGLLLGGFGPWTAAQNFQPVTSLDGTQSPPAGSGGDSAAPIISPDGRYVLFASTANNLLLTSSNAPISSPFPSKLNVFLADRTNGTTRLVSVNLSGVAGGNGDSLPVGLATNGQYVAFESSASDLVPGDTNGASDVFVRDVLNGVTTLVSVSTNGAVGNGASRSAAMTPDGRYIAFVSPANDLVAGDTNGIPDVFVRDLQAGVTTLASVGATAVSLSSSSESPDLTPDGRYVVFSSTATNLATGTPNTQDIYVRDLVGGTTAWASAGAKAAAVGKLNATSIVCYNHAISADGVYVAYEASPAAGSSSIFPGLILRYNLDSGVTDLVHANAAIEAATGGLDIRNLDMTPDGQHIVFVASTNGNSGATTCILLWDATTGASSLVSGDLNNRVVTNANCDWPTIDPTGQFVAFSSSATNLTTNLLSGTWHLYLRDLNAHTTRLLDADTNGFGSFIGPLTVACLSANAGFVAFECDDGNLFPNDRNRSSDVVVRDMSTGTIQLISAHDPALPSTTPSGLSLLGSGAVSGDGRYVAFASDADNLVANDTNGCREVFVRDQVHGTNILASIATNGWSGDGLSYEPSLSDDGQYVAFTSLADNLVAGDTNQATDVFVRDLLTGVTTLVSVNQSGTGPGNKASYSPVIGTGGRYVTFRSKATNLAAGSFGGTDNLFVRDLKAGTTSALTTGGVNCAAMTSDGHFVAFVNLVGTSVGQLYLWSNSGARAVYTNNTAGVSAVSLSPDGSRLAFWAAPNPATLVVADWAAGTSWALSSNAPASHPGPRFSADDRFLAYAAALNGTNQVYLYDLIGGTNLLVSRSDNAAAPGNGSSDWPDLSPDGRWVAYRSAASNLVPGDTNGLPDIFLFDRQSGSTLLLTVSQLGPFAANGRSLAPLFSGDGQTLLLQSWASDLSSADFNQSSDVFAYSLAAGGSIPVFYATIVPGAPGMGPWITWPVVPGHVYHVQYKNNWSDAWQELGGPVSVVGNQGYCPDLSPTAGARFYRVVGQ